MNALQDEVEWPRSRASWASTNLPRTLASPPCLRPGPSKQSGEGELGEVVGGGGVGEPSGSGLGSMLGGGGGNALNDILGKLGR